MANISSEILSLLNLQIAHELYNSSLYRKLGSHLKRLGLDNIGSFFAEDQVNEEISHAESITRFIEDRNEKVEALQIPEVKVEFNSMMQIADLYLNQEQTTTEKLKMIARTAIDENDFITFDFIREMITKQRTEESEALTFKDRAYMTGNDTKTILIWDANFKK